MQTGETVAIATILAVLALFSAHYLSARLSPVKLPRLTCYVIGVALIAAIFGGWCWFHSQMQAFGAFVAITSGAGLGTIAAWLVDHLSGTRIERKARQAQVDALNRRIRELEQRDGQ